MRKTYSALAALTLTSLASLGIWALMRRRATVSDEEFVPEAAMAGVKEVTLSRIALQQSRNDRILRFAQRMVDDHTKANKQLMRICEQKGIQLVATPGVEGRALAAELKLLEGPTFDHRYKQIMLEDHRQAVALFEREARSGQDPELRAFAERTLPTLQMHLAHARALYAGKPEPAMAGVR